MDLMKYPGEIAKIPINLLRTPAEYGMGVVRDSVGIFFPTESPREFARKLASEHVLEKADVAIGIAKAGQEAEVDAMEDEGKVQLAKFVIEAAESKCVPADVTNELVEKVVELVPDPELLHKLDELSDDEATTAETIVKKRRMVSRLSPKRQNKI